MSRAGSSLPYSASRVEVRAADEHNTAGQSEGLSKDLSNAEIISSQNALIQQRLTIDSLPTEIIQRIASLCTCHEVVSLAHANQKLHVACMDYAVFRDVIKHRNGYSLPRNAMWSARTRSQRQLAGWVQQYPPFWNGGFLSSSDPVSIWKAYALADLLAWKWIHYCRSVHWTIAEGPKGPESGSVSSWKQVLSWAPQLVLQRHPFILGLDIQSAMAIRTEEGSALGPTERHSCYLFLIIVLLEQSLPLLHIDKWRKWEKEKIGYNYFYARSDKPVNFPFWFVWAVLEYVSGVPPTEEGMIDPPRPGDIPFSTFVNLPPLFSGNAFDSLAKCYLNTMTSQTFLEDGEWEGYFCEGGAGNPARILHVPLEGASFRLPIRNITFSIPDEDPFSAPHTFRLNLSCTTTLGNFKLNGSMSADGSMVANGPYVNSEDWTWQTIEMTPVGIFGLWSVEDHFRGYFWIWKSSWAR